MDRFTTAQAYLAASRAWINDVEAFFAVRVPWWEWALQQRAGTAAYERMVWEFKSVKSEIRAFRDSSDAVNDLYRRAVRDLESAMDGAEQDKAFVHRAERYVPRWGRNRTHTGAFHGRRDEGQVRTIADWSPADAGLLRRAVDHAVTVHAVLQALAAASGLVVTDGSSADGRSSAGSAD